MRKSGRQLFAGPYLIWIIGFILLPLAMIIYYAFTTSGGTFTFENVAAIADPVHVRSILLSLKLGTICTIVCLLLAYPLAMILNGLKIKQQNFVVFIFILPMWMNFMLRILAWRLLLSNNGIVNAIFQFFGFGTVKMLNTQTAVVFGMVYDFLPFMILPIYNSMARIKNDVIEAAKDLGASDAIILFKIIIPLMMPSITVCSFLCVTNGFKLYDQNLALTNGAPSNMSEGLAMNITRTFYGRMGWEGVGQAKAVLFFILVAIVALIQNKLTTSKEVEA